jgi:hypothetical protein
MRLHCAICIWMIPLIVGCASSKRVKFVVHDAESGKPIPNAVITAHYANDGEFNFQWVPSDSTARTSPDGSCRMFVFNSQHQAHGYTVAAEGYTPGWTHGKTEEEIFLEPRDKFPDEIKMYLYRLPAPTITIVVPDGYHGPVLIAMLSDLKLIFPLGKRDFVYNYIPGRVLKIHVTPLFQLVDWGHFRGSYANGTPIPLDAPSSDPDQIAWHWVEDKYPGEIYFVGTRADAISLFHNLISMKTLPGFEKDFPP